METEAKTPIASININDLIRDLGFILMLSWHYLVLFTPVLSRGYSEPFEGGMCERQLVLYASLAVTFTLIAALTPHIAKRFKGFERNYAVLGVSGAFAAIISYFCVMPPVDSPLVIDITTALLGGSEAVMMWLWLSCIFSKHRNYDVLNEFSLNMVIAGLVSLQICSWDNLMGMVVAVLLPLLSTGVLLYEKKQFLLRTAEKEATNKKGRKHKQEESDGPKELDWNKTFKHDTKTTTVQETSSDEERHSLLTSIPIAAFFSLLVAGIFGFTFGLTQGAFVVDDIFLLMVNNPVVLLGISLAGLIIFATPRKHGVVFGANFLQYYALVLVVLGLVLLSFFNSGNIALAIAEIAILAGFNLFDSSAMMLGIGSSMDKDKRLVHIASGGRPVVYSAMFLGLLLGSFLASNATLGLNTNTAVCGIAIILLVTTTLLPYYSYSATKRSTTEEDDEAGEQDLRKAKGMVIPPLSTPSISHKGTDDAEKNGMTPWRSTCQEIANLYQLSPRETEVFFLLAKGRNAAYIWEKLVISPHTAKTHVANIYRKLEIHSSQELLDLVESFRKAEQSFSDDD